MLYGNIIFIKKTGGDGSKCPVTEKSIKIGRSEDCLIRIYNNKVALEHCQIIIADDGQATLKDLSNQTVLNDNLLVHGEVSLCHGDIFKIGERLARWEYLPSSKYFRQLSPSKQPTVRLVAVVMPQQRSVDDQSPPGTLFNSVLKNTPVGGKRQYSEKFTSENTSLTKMRKSSGSDLVRRTRDLSKFLTGRHSLKTTKLLLPESKIKDRKSTSGIVFSKTPKEKGRKSTLPSWKVNIVTPPSGRSSTSKSQKSPPKSEASNTRKSVKTPQKSVATPKKVVKSSRKTVRKTPLKPIKGSPLRSGGSVRSTSVSKSPSPKKYAAVSTPSLKPVRLIQSEKKTKSSAVRSSIHNKDLKRLSLAFNNVRKPARNLNKQLEGVFTSSEEKKSVFTPGVSEKTPRKSSVKKVISTPERKTSPRRSTAKKRPAIEELASSPAKSKKVRTSLLSLNMADSKQTPNSILKSIKSTPVKKTPLKLEKKSSSRKSRSVSSASSGSSKSSPAKTPARKISFSKERTSPRGVRRELSPSISAAERAAKKLKTSSPKKPDKNKKAALLVLGTAQLVMGKKRHMSQNLKVLLKQKIVKKAIKQSTIANVQKNDASKKAPVKTKPKKKVQKTVSKSKTKGKGKKKVVSVKTKTPTKSSKSAEMSPQGKDKAENSPKGENVVSGSKSVESSPRSSSKSKIVSSEDSGKSVLSPHKKTESPLSNLSKTPSEVRVSPYLSYEKAAENFLFNSNRRCSKRLSSKNDTGRPDFIELSPTALGLMPKNMEFFKTPKQSKRRSSSLATPKTAQSGGIIKSASTSKIGNRKSVRFSSKDISISSDFYSPNLSEKTNFDFGLYRTPDISMDAFISPLGDRSNISKKGLSESCSKVTFSPEERSEFSAGKTFRSSSEPRKCVRKLLQSPLTKQNEPVRGSRSSIIKSPSSPKVQQQSVSPATRDAKKESNSSEVDVKSVATPKNQRSPRKSLPESKTPQRLLRSPKDRKSPENLTETTGKTTQEVQKSPKNDLSDVRGVKKLLRTPKVQKSPKNNLSDVRGVKRLLKTPKVQKSPKNDLSDVRGVKKLLRTPKVQKSPKNNLSDVRGVKKLLRTPKVQKSPKNDLSDVRGVKKLLRTPKVQKSPKNNLSDVRGVKRLLKTPKVQKSPKNDLSDLKGVKKLLRTPKVQKSPKNDLSDVRGVKKLLRTPKEQKSPKNDLSDVRGVKKLLRTPKVQKSPKNNLSDVRGVKKLLTTPKERKSPKNDLSDLKGVKKLLATPKVQKSPKNDLSDIAGVKELFQSPKTKLLDLDKVQKLLESPKLQMSLTNDLNNSKVSNRERFLEFLKGKSVASPQNKKGNKIAERGLSKSPKSGKGETSNARNIADVKQLQVAKNPGSVAKSKKVATSRVSRVNDFRAIRGRRTICSSPKGPKNDLSDVTGVRELFARHKPISDYNVNLTGVAELFDLAEVKATTRKVKITVAKSTAAEEKQPRRTLRSEKITEESNKRGRSLKKGAAELTTKRTLRGKKSKLEEKVEAKSTEDKTAKTKKATVKKTVKSPAVISRSLRVTKGVKKVVKSAQEKGKVAGESGEKKEPRKRKAEVEIAPISPPKLRRKTTNEESTSGVATETVTKTRTRTKTQSTEKVSGKSVRKKVTKGKEKLSKSPTKVRSETLKKGNAKKSTEIKSKVQNKRSQKSSKESLSESEEKVSSVRTRSAKSESVTQKRLKTQTTTADKKTHKTTAGRKKLTTVVKKSTRRK